MKIYIWDLIFGNCKKGIHKFEEFEIKESMPQITMRRFTAYHIEAIKTRVYETRCKHCGIKAE